MSEPIGYPELSLGLNNQKLALFGLFSKAQNIKKPLTLPQFCNFDAAHGQHILVPLDTIYSRTHLDRFAQAFGLDIIDGPPASTENGWGSFIGGCDRHGRDARQGPGSLDDFTCQFFKNLVPTIIQTSVFKKLHDEVFVKRGIKIVLQLRIENDWAEEAAKQRARPQTFADEFDLNFRQIVAKIHNTMPAEICSNIFVVCDETNLPVSKTIIQSVIQKELGINLIWKSDILAPNEIATLSLLAKSTLDFEMAARAPLFVGFSRSTFANLATFEAFCRLGRPPPAHFIYNNQGRQLAQRHDLGTGIDPRDVSNKLYSRYPLVEDHTDDCLWPGSITAHLSGIGDFTTISSIISGTRRGHLVAGIRHDGFRLIENFSISLSKHIPGNLEYRARLADARWTDWTPAGRAVGTAAQHQILSGFAVRLTGPVALAYDCHCIASFKDKPDLVHACQGNDCAAEPGCQLESMQIIFRPRNGNLEGPFHA